MFYKIFSILKFALKCSNYSNCQTHFFTILQTAVLRPYKDYFCEKGSLHHGIYRTRKRGQELKTIIGLKWYYQEAARRAGDNLLRMEIIIL